MRSGEIIALKSIAYPSEKGGYNILPDRVNSLRSIAYPSEKGGYNLFLVISSIF